MARGQVFTLPNQQKTLVTTESREQKNSFALLNPNDGVCYLKLNGDAGPAASQWDWKLPSQSYGHFPGPWQSLGVYFLDQSGANRSGDLNLYDSDVKLEIPDIVGIGRALQAFSSNLDITEGTIPANPGAGNARLWVDANHVLHLLDSAGVDRLEASDRTALGGVLTGTLPNPGLAGLSVTQGHLVKPSVSTGELFDAGITQAKLAKPSVGTAELLDRTIIGGKVAFNTLSNNELVGGTALANIGAGGLTATYLAGGAAFTNLGFSAVGKIILDVRAASDLWSNTALGPGYNGIGGFNSNNGTVDETGDLLIAIAEFACQIASNPVQAYFGSALYIDGVLYKRFPGIFVPASTPSQTFGGGVCYLPGIAAGSHNFEIRVYVSSSGMSSGAYLRCATAPETEYAAITILEIRR